jgi:hypothetical protein
MTLPCGCCEGIRRLTPALISNPPHLSELDYRVGTYASFFDSMVARLSDYELVVTDDPPTLPKPLRPLTNLTTRLQDDPSIALLDAWAMVADVLTFYQERIANEGYLPTATERRSISGLAALVGYALRPGVAASGHLAFAIEDGFDVEVPAGTKGQTLPGPGELPQAFETGTTLAARGDWNDLQPRQTRPQKITTGWQDPIYLQGTATNLKPNDPILLVFGPGTGDQEFRWVKTASPDPAFHRTKVLLQPPPTAAAAAGEAGQPGLVPRGRLDSPKVALPTVSTPAFPSSLAALDLLLTALSKPPSVPPMGPGSLAPTLADVFSAGSDQQVKLLAALRSGGSAPYRALANATVTSPSPVTFYALRLTSQLFGHSAPKRLLLDLRLVEWPIIEYSETVTPPAQTLHEHSDVIDLDGSHPEVVPDSWLVVSTQQTPLTDAGNLIAQVTSVDANLSRADYGISGNITEITLKSGNWINLETADEAETPTYERGEDEALDEQDDFNAIRKTVVYAQSELLPRAEEPIAEDVKGNAVELGALYDGLEPGRWLIVTGDRTDIPNTTLPGGELVMLDRVEQSFDSTLPGDRMHSTLHLANGLAYTYARGSSTVYGNVVPATHGETHREVLGSGDGSRASQEFTLRHPYLTYVSARNPRGAVSTLQVFVDDIPWQEVEGFTGVGPKAHVFTTKISDDAKTTVTFGDGRRAARLPTGSENVRAVYRSGIGTAGNASPAQITLLATKPLGVKSVVNPLAIAPGADPEGRDSGRRNVPLGVAPLDRLVSVHDYEQFAVGFGGIGQASAQRIWDGWHDVIHVTVAGMDTGSLLADSQMLLSLVDAFQLSGDVAQPVQVAPREFLFLVVCANVALVPGWSWDSVSASIRGRLFDSFGFEARGFGQYVESSEVVSVIQSVAGVAWVQLTILDAIPETISAAQFAVLATGLRLRRRIRVRLARPAPRQSSILPAQLAVLKPDLKGTLLLTQVMG